MKILKCQKCKTIHQVLKEGTCKPTCCGEEMKELIANTTDAAKEKHVPVVTQEEKHITVTCGEVPHPMEENHYIEMMMIETNKGLQIKYLKPQEEPVAHFILEEEETFQNAYAYCNLHGLWKNN